MSHSDEQRHDKLARAVQPIPVPNADTVKAEVSPVTPDMPEKSSYAMTIADNSYTWYREHAIRSRAAYKVSETFLLVVSASIPVVAAIEPNDATIPAILGAVVVIVAGLRSVFHWQDNYLRFSEAREEVEAERRLYKTAAKPYDDPSTRDQLLVSAVSRIEHDEMSGWLKIAIPRPKP